MIKRKPSFINTKQSITRAFKFTVNNIIITHNQTIYTNIQKEKTH